MEDVITIAGIDILFLLKLMVLIGAVSLIVIFLGQFHKYILTAGKILLLAALCIGIIICMFLVTHVIFYILAIILSLEFSVMLVLLVSLVGSGFLAYNLGKYVIEL